MPYNRNHVNAEIVLRSCDQLLTILCLQMAMIDDQIKKIKLKVLEEQRHYLSKRLDPNRYNIFLKTKGILDIFSIQKINAKVTDPEKVDLLIDEMVSHIEGRHGEPPLDLLVEAIYSEGMQNHIARVLLKAFLRECAEEGIGLQYGDCKR